MATHVCSQCGHEEPIFGSGGGEEMAGQYNVDVLASLPLSKIVRETADAGVAMLHEAPEDPASQGFRQAASALWLSLCAAKPNAGPVITMGDD
jgi:ATP-binding protein involved in chromosome partitioning